MAQFVNSSEELSQTPGQQGNPFPGASPEISTGGTTGQITKVISERRSSRRQWRLFEICLTVAVDTLLLYVAFLLAYYLRYQVLFNSELIAYFRSNVLGGREKDVPADISQFLLLGAGVALAARLPLSS